MPCLLRHLTGQKCRKIIEIPVNFPVSRETEPENRQTETAMAIPRLSADGDGLRRQPGRQRPGNSGIFRVLFRETTKAGTRWRREWDSNPRYAYTHNGFRDRPIQPLWHPSAGVLEIRSIGRADTSQKAPGRQALPRPLCGRPGGAGNDPTAGAPRWPQKHRERTRTGPEKALTGKEPGL